MNDDDDDDDELIKMIKEMTEIILGNTFYTLQKEDYKRLESLALYIGHDNAILKAHTGRGE
jgi:hypothetical protein